MMKVVYISHPFRGDVAVNRERVRHISKAVKRDYVPLAPHLLLPAYADEATERDRAILRGADELWVCAKDASKGMAGEIAEARRLGLPVYRVDANRFLGRRRPDCHEKVPWRFNGYRRGVS